MQILDVIQTVRWIDSCIYITVKSALFSDKFRIIREAGEAEDFVPKIIEISQSWGRSLVSIESNPKAVEILNAFELSLLMDRDAVSNLFSFLIIGSKSEDSDSTEILRKIGRQYNLMIDTVDSWEKLTIPQDLRGDKPPKYLLTFNINPPESSGATLAFLSEVSLLIDDLHQAILRIYSIKDDAPLSILKVESGSIIRINCKGSDKSIEKFKELIIEVWHKVRHKRPEELIENNKALTSSLEVIDHINERASKGGLSPEDAEALRRRVINDSLGLFKCGALINEIPENEHVDNAKLLGAFTPKLLPAVKETTSRHKKSITKKPKKKKKVARKKEGKAK